MIQPVRSILIVGAGSAGWLSALVLTTYCPFVKVRLLRPGGGRAIGVDMMLYGLLLMVVIRAEPRGVIAILDRWVGKLRGSRGEARAAAKPATAQEAAR